MTLTSEQQAKLLWKQAHGLAKDLQTIAYTGREVAKNPTKLNLFRGMFRTVTGIYDKFNELVDQLYALHLEDANLPEFPDTSAEGIIASAKNYFFEIHGLFEEHCSPAPSGSPTTFNLDQTLAALASRPAESQLPKLNLPTFTGLKLTDWPLYRDTFQTLVHANDRLTPITKFHYLIGSLAEPALSAIKTIALDGNNYNQAWKSLLQQYDNPRKLASSYIDKILSGKVPANKSSIHCIQHFLTHVAEHITSLKNMNIQNFNDYIIFELAIRCVDSSTREAFELKNSGTNFPSYDTLLNFVKARYQALLLVPERPIELSNTGKKPPNPPKGYSKPQSNSNSTFFVQQTPGDSKSSPTTQKNNKVSFNCFICSANHSLPFCPQFNSAESLERLQMLKSFKGCFNCLHPKHPTDKCQSKFACRICKLRHHTELHDAMAVQSTRKPTEQQTPNKQNPKPAIPVALTALAARNSEILLGTAQARIKDKHGVYQNFRLVVDSGSQLSFATKSLIDRLGLAVQPFSKPIVGVGQSQLASPEGRVNCILAPVGSAFPSVSVSAVVVDTITSFLPQCCLPQALRQKYAHFELADPSFWTPGPIDMLLGADVFMEVLLSAPIRPYPNQPSLLKTIFGHIIIGRLEVEHEKPLVSCFATTSQLDSIMNKFWEVEEVPQSKKFTSASDLFCEEHFSKTHRRLSDGRYEVALPFKGEVGPSLGNSKRQALTRLYNLELKLHRNPLLRSEYHNFLLEYLQLDHMEPTNHPGEYTIPHHGVFKTGTTSKIRVVFDASASTTRGSLNDHLHVGPKLQNSICHVLLNFRRHPIVFSADCVKMYRQISVQPADRKYQHILWRFDSDATVQEYELKTVTYGMSCSSFLSHRVLQQLVEDEGVLFPLASRALLEDSYVDDLTTGAATIEEALQLRDQLIQLLAKGCFALGKWCSNDPRILETLTDTSANPVHFLPDENLKILGSQWKPQEDTLCYHVNPFEAQPTKRSILSAIARVYDPLGYLAPVIFQAKIILQDTWNSDVDWDETVPPEIAERWAKFSSELPSIAEIQIPRYLKTCGASQFDIVGFSDASERGYCACIFLRVLQENSFHTFLIQAKTKLSPRKTIMTIPRLELCGAHLLTQLYASLLPFFAQFSIKNCYFFTDSSIVLAWLRTSPDLLKIFVAHRISYMLEVTQPDWWFHVRSEHNPADCGSRGLFPSQLELHPLWWSGPEWLTSAEELWPASHVSPHPPFLEEMKTQVSFLVTKNDLFVTWTERFSSYLSLVRSFAYVQRFWTHSLKKGFHSGPISVSEFQTANLRCIWLLQQHYFANRTDRKVQDLFANLNVFEDSDGLLRVGGRLLLSGLPYPQRHPLLLPKPAHFTLLLVRWYHQVNLHAGSQALHATILQRYWIPGAKLLIRKVKTSCKRCLTFTKQHLNPYMGNLPASRFATERAFFHTGVDFAGPLLCKESSRRNATSHKSYVCVFVCFATKAIHLEVVPNLSTEGFLDALDRFIARRGTPAQIFSDCGSNFLGAAKYLKEVEEWFLKPETQRNISTHCTPKAINWNWKTVNWHFNPPYAPHFGGLWESGVKSFKTQLYKSIGNQPFTERELATIITKIEGILNSRPLFTSSSDPNDPCPLTPAHLLIGGPINAIPEPELTHLPQNRLSRWQFIRQRTQSFWNSWKRDYLNTLQQRRKWTKQVPNLHVGDLVLLKKADCSPFQWPMGRIEQIHPGADNIVRVLTVKTATGTYRRAIQEVIPLTPLTEEESSPTHETSTGSIHPDES